MGNRFASAKIAIGLCDRCGFRFPLRQMRTLVVKTKQVNVLVCPECWEPDQPQLQVGMRPVYDPQALRNPRPDNTYEQSRDIQWGWNPVGGGNAAIDGGTPNNLVGTGFVGTVTVSVS